MTALRHPMGSEAAEVQQRIYAIDGMRLVAVVRVFRL